VASILFRTIHAEFTVLSAGLFDSELHDREEILESITRGRIPMFDLFILSPLLKNIYACVLVFVRVRACVCVENLR
jgi:hypothetical protein